MSFLFDSVWNLFIIGMRWIFDYHGEMIKQNAVLWGKNQDKKQMIWPHSLSDQFSSNIKICWDSTAQGNKNPRGWFKFKFRPSNPKTAIRPGFVVKKSTFFHIDICQTLSQLWSVFNPQTSLAPIPMLETLKYLTISEVCNTSAIVGWSL